MAIHTPNFPATPLALACLLAMTATPVAADQVTATDDAKLPEVVISASRQEALSDDLPVSLDVLDQQKAERAQVQDIRDAVRELPNVAVPRAPVRFTNTGPANSTGRDGNAGFSIRGLGGNRVLMLVDGIRVPHSYIYGSNAFGRDYVSLDLLKRMEVVRGPTSALYGSDGLAGLVNIITHDPEDFLATRTGESRMLGGRLSMGWTGDDEGASLSGTVAGRASDTVQWLLTASRRKAHELETKGTVDSPDKNRTTANPQQDRDEALLAKLVWRPDAEQRHVLTMEKVDRDSEVNLLSSRTPRPFTGTAQQIASAVLDERARSTSTRTRLTWDARYRLTAALADELRTVLGVQHADARQLASSDLNTSPDRVRDVSYSERSWQAGVQASKTASLSQGWSRKLTYGIDYQRSDVRNIYTGVNPLAPEVFPLKRFPDTRESGSALYAQGEWLNDRFSLVPGVRADYYAVKVLTQDGFSPPAQPGRSLSGSAISPKLGALYRFRPEWSVFGNYAGGFRAPNAHQINGYFDNPGLFVKIVPNPDLKPEKSRNVEVGVRGRMPRLELDVAAFSGRFTNLIQDLRPISGGGTSVDDYKVFQTVNVDKARIHGFEVKGNYAWGVLAGGRVGMPFSYGQAQGKNSVTGTPLSSVEPAKLTLGLDYQANSWSLRLLMRHHAAKHAQDIDSAELVKPPKEQIALPSATTLDLFGQWRLRKDVRLNAGITNLTDRKYWMWSDVRGLESSTTVADAYTQPGRNSQLFLVIDF